MYIITLTLISALAVTTTHGQDWVGFTTAITNHLSDKILKIIGITQNFEPILPKIIKLINPIATTIYRLKHHNSINTVRVTNIDAETSQLNTNENFTQTSEMEDLQNEIKPNFNFESTNKNLSKPVVFTLAELIATTPSSNTKYRVQPFRNQTEHYIS